MRAALLAPASASDTYFVAGAGAPLANHTIICDCAIRSYVDDTYHASYADSAAGATYHVRSTSAGLLRLGRTSAAALNLWSDGYTGRATWATAGNASATGNRTAFYRRERQSAWTDAGTISHNLLTTPDELLIGRPRVAAASGTSPTDYWGYWIYNRQLSLAEIKAVDAGPRDREPTITQGLVYYWTALRGALDFGRNHWRRRTFAFAQTGTNLKIGADWPVRVRMRAWSPVGSTAATSTGSGGSASAAQAAAGKGVAVATAFGATSQAAQVTAGKGASVAAGKGATAQGAQVTGGVGAAVSTGSGGSSAAAQVTGGVGAGLGLSTGSGGSAAAAQAAGGKGGAVATGSGGGSSPAQITGGKGGAVATGKGGGSSAAQATGGKGGAVATGSGGSTAAPQATTGYNPGGQSATGTDSQARRRLPPHRDY